MSMWDFCKCVFDDKATNRKTLKIPTGVHNVVEEYSCSDVKGCADSSNHGLEEKDFQDAVSDFDYDDDDTRFLYKANFYKKMSLKSPKTLRKC